MLSLFLPLITHAGDKWKRPLYLTCPTKKKNSLELLQGEVGNWDLELIRARIKGKKVTAIAYDLVKYPTPVTNEVPRKAAFVEVKKLSPDMLKYAARLEGFYRKICLGTEQDKEFFEIDLEMNRIMILGVPVELSAK